ncbi:MAG: hypothetical protein RML48_04745 [Candidatus Bipolaricaulota bacterium]|nr:hypothetical protein [Candidatus Bipolaricaulota bacterium]MDW8031606.1 hypothetical protein [Candidatus Bipolaricaulota bacterium]MDW8329271.1 hypothetical protein [Candidatus Bipolaricaulota bacterium]
MKPIWIVLAAILAVAAGFAIFLSLQKSTPHTETLIPYTQAREHAGQTVTVWGTIRNVFNNRLAVYLGFTEPRRGSFFVRILKEDWPNFPQHPETLYRPGQTVRVRGKIVWYQGDPVIYVRHPAQIEITTKEAQP